MIVTLYSRERCSLCLKARDILLELREEHGFTYKEVDIDEDDHLIEKYGIMIPVVNIDGQDVQFGVIDKMFIDKAISE